MLRTPTILPNIRISRCIRTTFILILERVTKSYNHVCASTSWFMTFDPGIIKYLQRKPFAMKIIFVRHGHPNYRLSVTYKNNFHGKRYVTDIQIIGKTASLSWAISRLPLLLNVYQTKGLSRFSLPPTVVLLKLQNILRVNWESMKS